MFRRLAQLEAFESNAQTNYTQEQSYQYNVFLPRMIPTGSSYPAPSDLQTALQNVDTRTGSAIDVVPDVQRIFRPTGPAPSLLTRQQVCVASSLDELAGSQDPSQRVRCGWMYTPPTSGSPIPQLSQGYLGTSSGPLQGVGATVPPYQKWFWDLGQAQQQVRTDVCKSLKTCTNVGADPYSNCGYCTDIGQGVPVNAAGQALYPTSTLTRCSPSSLITSASSCPAPSSAGGPGPSPQQPTCMPNASGQLSVPCLEQTLTQAGCDQGTLALALSSGATPSDYMAKAKTLPAMTVYNRVATQPFNMALFSQGQGTVAAALQEAARVVSAAAQPSTSALGASARDLCLQPGAIAQFDFCSELLPTTPMSTVDPSCLQKAFYKAGGNENGTMFPSSANTAALTYYSTLGTWGKFLQYLTTLNASAKGPSTNEGFASKRTARKAVGYKTEGFLTMDQQVHQTYQTQSLALAQLRGITPDALVTNRVNPGSPGIDLVGLAYNANGVWFMVAQTVIPSLSSMASYTGHGVYAFMTVTDLRVGAATPYILSASGSPLSFLTRNQPTWKNTTASTSATSPSIPLSATDPNVLRMQILATPTLTFTESSSTAVTPTLVRESPRAPWLMLELDPATSRSTFQNLLFPDLLQPVASTAGTVANGTTDLILKSPGKNGYIQLNGGTGTLTIPSLSYSVLNTFTVVFMQSGGPVGNALLTLTSSVATLTVFLGTDNQVIFSGATVDGAVPSTNTGIFVTPGTWYMMVVSMPVGSPSWLVSVQTLSYAQQSTTNLATTVTNTFKFSTVSSPALVSTANQYLQVGLGLGDVTPNRGVSPTFQLNVAWIHFFSQAPSGPELVRDALNNWQITQPELA